MDNLVTVPMVDELNGIAQKLQELIGVERDELLEEVAAQLNKKPSLVARLFPSPIEKERTLLTVQTLKMLYADKEKLFRFHSAIKFEVAKLYATTLVASVGMGLQTKLAKFAQLQIDELGATIGQSRKAFIQNIMPQLKELEQCDQFPVLKELARLSIENEMKIYFTTINTLLEGFIQNLRGRSYEFPSG